ncbi:NADP-dependent oxidoreductase [Actinomadura sp. BRA 177]|uniref:NADP-dependent oxidoreductase n=1 Tax=Actinomadura sp. BRA 177 TaxID=2745202 RepID=UPI0015952F1B|nr:NADP-dependent oxidoreductase [Actinomadura sp. BRA 177]NVI91246.1 NADP-dependent oxidoreductase [Actinomadura sp. BRA 177]
MKAYVRIDTVDQRVELADVEVPSPDADEVALEVHAFGVGVHDRYFISPEVAVPYVIGLEAAGVVTAVGSAVHGVAVGDRVMATTMMNPKGGTWAESVVVNQRGVAPIPDEFDFTTAAAIPIAGDAAVECMHTLGMQPNQTLYVAGASGAIGTLVVQLAAQRGVRVVGAASPANHDYVRSLGAELAVDYRDPAWADAVRAWAPGGVDSALAIQPGTPASSRAVVRDGGHLVSVSGDPCPSERGIFVEQFAHRPDVGADMAELVEAIAHGRINLEIERVYAFDEALAALEKTETRHARGKVVVEVRRAGTSATKGHPAPSAGTERG